jgi:glycosyltransferase involved in cell wall biosynthesis
MKILFITQSLEKGGAERLTIEIARAIQLHFPTVQTKIVSLSPNNDFKHLSEDIDISYINSNVKLSIKGSSLINIEEYETIVSEFKPDVIHSHTYKAELVTREKPRPNIKYITHVHDHFTEFNSIKWNRFFSKKQITNYYERIRIFKKYKDCNNSFITISHKIHRNLLSQLNSSWISKIFLLPNAIDFKTFNSSSRIVQQKNVNLISVGRLYLVKNHSYLIKVVNELYLKEPDINWNLSILGEGIKRKDIEDEITKYDLEHVIKLPGLISHVEEHLKRSDLYVHSATSEPFGLVLIEAMAASLPVISLNGGGNSDFIINNKNGIILSLDTPPSKFADYIIKLTKDKELYSEIAKAANATAREYDIKEYVTKLLAIYNDNTSAVN